MFYFGYGSSLECGPQDLDHYPQLGLFVLWMKFPASTYFLLFPKYAALDEIL